MIFSLFRVLSCICVGRGAAPGQKVEDARSLVTRMLRLLPGVRIIVSRILPPAESWLNVVDPRIHPEEMNLTALATDRKIADRISRVDRASYLGHPVFADKSGIRRDLLSKDGLHLSPGGVRMLAVTCHLPWHPCSLLLLLLLHQPLLSLLRLFLLLISPLHLHLLLLRRATLLLFSLPLLLVLQ